MATIHAYRRWGVTGVLVKPSIYVDGKALGRLRNGKFLVAEITPGKHMITSGRTEGGYLVDFESGKHYYFRMGRRLSAGFTGAEPMTLDLVAADEAEREVSNLKPNQQ